jgi:hypothetical protein
MSAFEILMDCLYHYAIPVEKTEDNKVWVSKGYMIEVETNGLYKLLQHGEVIAPFDDLNELCGFILQYD